MALSDQHQRFVAEYLVDLNATEAAIRAGYSPKTASQQGSRLLGNAKIAEAVAAGAKKRLERLEQKGVDADTVLSELLRIATVDIAEAFDGEGKLKPIHEIPVDVRRAISAVEIDELWDTDVDEDSGRKVKVQTGFTRKVKFWDKPKTLEALGRHLKLFTDVVEHRADDELAQIIREARERNARR